MPKIPYDRIFPQASKLIEKMTTAPNMETADYYWEAYVALLEGAGWTVSEFEQEEAKRVEEGWEDAKPTIWN